MDKLDTLLQERAYEPPSENLAERITTAARFRSQKQQTSIYSVRRMIATAAVVLIAVSATMIWQENMSSPEGSPMQMADATLQETQQATPRKQGVVGYLDWVYEDEPQEDGFYDYYEWDI